MLDIRLIRERPDWVREQLARLHDEDALPRLDKIIELDVCRRQALSEAESLQTYRNRLNRAFGRLHGQRRKDPVHALQCAIAARKAITDKDYGKAEAALLGEIDQTQTMDLSLEEAFTDLNAVLRVMGDQYQELHQRAQEIGEELHTEMLWLPNLPHESVPVSPDEADNVPGHHAGISVISISPRCHTGKSDPDWESSILSVASA